MLNLPASSLALPRAARLIPCLALLALSVACATLTPTDASVDARAQELALPNLGHPEPMLWTAGQISEEQMAALAEAGVHRIICLRDTEEEGTGWEEQAAERLGLTFVRLPVRGGQDIDWQRAGSLHDLLAAGDGEPQLLYCGSSNRVGALLALRANGQQGLSVDDAIRLGREAGLTRLEPVVAQKLRP